MAIDIIIQFVEGKLPVDDFLDNLYNNKELESTLSENIALDSYIGGNLHLFLLEQDLTTQAGIVNSIGALKSFLTFKKIAFTENEEASKLHLLLLKAQPSWLYIPSWYMKELLALANGKKGNELEKFLKEEIKRRFRYLKKAPKWVQSPEWVFENGKPLIFIAQNDITAIRHDNAQLYIFFDENNNTFHFVEQTS